MRRLLFIFFVLICLPFCLPCAHADSLPSVLTLDSCLQLARENSATIRQAELRVQMAKQVQNQALTKYFPQVQATAVAHHSLRPPVDIGIEDLSNASVRDLLLTLYGNYGEALGLENTLSLFQHGMSAGVTAIQPVFMGGKIIAGNQLAKVGVEAAKLQQQVTERDFLEQVEESYWLVVGLQDKQRTIRQITLLLDTVQQMVSSAVDAGLALPQDLLKVRVNRAELNRQTIRLQSGLMLATRSLCQSIGMPYSDSLVLPIPELHSVDAPSPAMDTFSASEQESSLLALQVRAAQLERTMTLADAMPHVALGANYGYSRYDANILRNGLGGWNGALFVTVSVPLTAWWETSHKLREKSLKLEEARLQQSDLGEKLMLRTEQAFYQWQESAMLLSECEEARQLAQEQYRLTQSSYRAGMSTIADLLTAESDLLTAINNYTDAQIAYLVSTRRYHDLVSPRH